MEPSGFPIERDFGRCFHQIGETSSRTGYLRETRATLALSRACPGSVPYYSVIYLANSKQVPFPSAEFVKMVKTNELKPLSGLAKFLHLIAMALKTAYRAWNEAISFVEGNLRVTVNNACQTYEC
jgi:hypothetical protein